MRITIEGHNLPGRRFTSQGVPLANVHVAVQEGRDPVGMVRGDARSATWEVDVNVVPTDDGGLDLRGKAVHGKRGDRFLYLTWGEVHGDGSFDMFRRAKLMIAEIDSELLARGADGPGLTARVDLTDDFGCPRCARVRPPNIAWALSS